MSGNKTLALIPARGGSKAIPQKNIKLLSGQPLIGYSIRAAKDAASVDTVVVSTDDSDIAQIAESCGASVPFVRPKALARDATPTEPVIQHAIETLEDQEQFFDNFILLQPTSPLRNATHIDEAYELYQTNQADSVISAWPCYDNLWKERSNEAEKLTPSDAPSQRQRREPVYITNGAVYLTSVDAFMRTGDLTNGRTVIYEMSERNSIDIDTPFDLWLAEHVIQEGIND